MAGGWKDLPVGYAMEPPVLDALPGPARGQRSGLSVPVKIGDRMVGVFALFSREPHAYSTRDLTLAERLGAYVAVALAHQRLAGSAREAAVERERSAKIENSVETRRAISNVLYIRTGF